MSYDACTDSRCVRASRTAETSCNMRKCQLREIRDGGNAVDSAETRPQKSDSHTCCTHGSSNRGMKFVIVGFAFVCAFYCMLPVAIAGRIQINCNKNKVYDCTNKIYCTGDLLRMVQLAELFNDSKTFVDLSQVNSPDVTLKNFQELMSVTNGMPSREQLENFVNQNFVNDAELEKWTPPDWRENPLILKRISDPLYRNWAKELNKIWKVLAMKVKQEVAQHPDKHSLIYVNNGFIIPGGRFKEFYYWDSYWIIKGLLLSDMHKTAKGMIENFLQIVQKYSFVPNGGRVYYLMRSQPPLLTPMVYKYFQFTQDLSFVKQSLPLLDKEFEFWVCERSVNVEKNGNSYSMFRYNVDSDGPRPESYREDYNLAQGVPDGEKRALFKNLKGAAESGWDFSSRWFIGKQNDDSCDSPPDPLGCRSITDVATRYIIPVDLNCFLERNARYLFIFHQLVGNHMKAKYYKTLARVLRRSIEDVLWNEEDGTWYDYDISNKQPRNTFYPSNLTPLYTMSYNKSYAKKYGARTVEYLDKQDVTKYWGGTPTSYNPSGQQWDFPNAWPPLQSLIVLGLLETTYEPAVRIGTDLAERWLRANLAGYNKYNEMFEKYDAVNPGQFGGGGEYTVQAGFGWTNGVVFEFLDVFPNASAHDKL